MRSVASARKARRYLMNSILIATCPLDPRHGPAPKAFYLKLNHLEHFTLNLNHLTRPEISYFRPR